MEIIEQKVDSGEFDIFDLDEFLSRPLFAHLSTVSPDGPRESPVWFLWDGAAIWIIGGESFPRNIQREGRVAIGLVDFNPVSGMLHHVGMRGTAEVLPYNQETAKLIIQKYCGPVDCWDRRFDDIRLGTSTLPMIRFVPTKVVMRDQSYHVGRTGSEGLLKS